MANLGMFKTPGLGGKGASSSRPEALFKSTVRREKQAKLAEFERKINKNSKKLRRRLQNKLSQKVKPAGSELNEATQQRMSEMKPKSPQKRIERRRLKTMLGRKLPFSQKHILNKTERAKHLKLHYRSKTGLSNRLKRNIVYENLRLKFEEPKECPRRKGDNWDERGRSGVEQESSGSDLRKGLFGGVKAFETGRVENSFSPKRVLKNEIGTEDAQREGKDIKKRAKEKGKPNTSKAREQPIATNENKKSKNEKKGNAVKKTDGKKRIRNFSKKKTMKKLQKNDKKQSEVSLRKLLGQQSTNKGDESEQMRMFYSLVYKEDRTQGDKRAARGQRQQDRTADRPMQSGLAQAKNHRLFDKKFRTLNFTREKIMSKENSFNLKNMIKQSRLRVASKKKSLAMLGSEHTLLRELKAKSGVFDFSSKARKLKPGKTKTKSGRFQKKKFKAKSKSKLSRFNLGDSLTWFQDKKLSLNIREESVRSDARRKPNNTSIDQKAIIDVRELSRAHSKEAADGGGDDERAPVRNSFTCGTDESCEWGAEREVASRRGNVVAKQKTISMDRTTKCKYNTSKEQFFLSKEYLSQIKRKEDNLSSETVNSKKNLKQFAPFPFRRDKAGCESQEPKKASNLSKFRSLNTRFRRRLMIRTPTEQVRLESNTGSRDHLKWIRRALHRRDEPKQFQAKNPPNPETREALAGTGQASEAERQKVSFISKMCAKFEPKNSLLANFRFQGGMDRGAQHEPKSKARKLVSYEQKKHLNRDKEEAETTDLRRLIRQAKRKQPINFSSKINNTTSFEMEKPKEPRGIFKRTRTEQIRFKGNISLSRVRTQVQSQLGKRPDKAKVKNKKGLFLSKHNHLVSEPSRDFRLEPGRVNQAKLRSIAKNLTSINNSKVTNQNFPHSMQISELNNFAQKEPTRAENKMQTLSNTKASPLALKNTALNFQKAFAHPQIRKFSDSRIQSGNDERGQRTQSSQILKGLLEYIRTFGHRLWRKKPSMKHSLSAMIKGRMNLKNNIYSQFSSNFVRSQVLDPDFIGSFLEHFAKSRAGAESPGTHEHEPGKDAVEQIMLSNMDLIAEAFKGFPKQRNAKPNVYAQQSLSIKDKRLISGRNIFTSNSNSKTDHFALSTAKLGTNRSLKKPKHNLQLSLSLKKSQGLGSFNRGNLSGNFSLKYESILRKYKSKYSSNPKRVDLSSQF